MKKDWALARDIFAELGDYKESQTKLSSAQKEIEKLDKKYETAQKYWDEGKYKKAFYDFESLGTYRESYSKMCELRDLLVKDIQSAKVGDFVLFGRYRQTEYYGEDPIIWEVTEADDEYIRVESHSILECKAFDTDGNRDWENSSLRAWLNGDFYNNSFNDEEKKTMSGIAYKNHNYTDRIGLEWVSGSTVLDTPYVAQMRKEEDSSGCWGINNNHDAVNSITGKTETTTKKKGVRIFMYINR